jgi:hypothetical protein
MPQPTENNSQASKPEKHSHGIYYVIPAAIMDREDLNPMAKLLYALLSGLAHEDRKCFPSDKYLSERLHLALRQVKLYILKLEEVGLISRETHPCSANPFKKIRTITVHADFTKRPCESAEKRPPEVRKNALRVSEANIVSEENSYVGSEPPTSEIPLSKENQEEKKAFPIDAWDAANNLWSHVLKHFPKHLHPKLDLWAKHFDIMNRRDKRSWEDIRNVIDFIFNDAFWAKVIQSPESLRKNFDKILAKMTPVDNTGSRIAENAETARNAKRVLSQSNQQNKLTIYKASVVNENTGESVSLDLPPQTFTSILANWFELEVKNG